MCNIRKNKTLIIDRHGWIFLRTHWREIHGLRTQLYEQLDRDFERAEKNMYGAVKVKNGEIRVDEMAVGFSVKQMQRLLKRNKLQCRNDGFILKRKRLGTY